MTVPFGTVARYLTGSISAAQAYIAAVCPPPDSKFTTSLRGTQHTRLHTGGNTSVPSHVISYHKPAGIYDFESRNAWPCTPTKPRASHRPSIELVGTSHWNKPLPQDGTVQGFRSLAPFQAIWARGICVNLRGEFVSRAQWLANYFSRQAALGW